MLGEYIGGDNGLAAQIIENTPHNVVASATIMTRLLLPGIVATIALLMFSGCADPEVRYLTASVPQSREMEQLLDELAAPGKSDDVRFAINSRIISLLHAGGETGKLNVFLTEYVAKHPDDKNNAYYLLLVADIYRVERAYPFAILYYDRVLRNYQDLLIAGGQSVHYLCLTNLTNLVEQPEIRIGYYRELVSRFGDQIDKGSVHYYMARTYEQIGEWNLAIQAYKEFLRYPETSIRQDPHAHQNAESMVKLFELKNKRWPRESLEELIAQIRNAIWRRDARALNALRSKVGFFARAWEEDRAKTELALVSDLSVFIRQGGIRTYPLDRDSNDREAYLKTTGWSFRIRTWYLYFRKIHFPADPRIHGDWEWAGIYLGEKPY